MQLLKKIIVAILTWESRLILAKYKPYIVAVTGSVGKTSTKDAIYDVLKNESAYVRKSQKSMNSDIGLPLTIIGVPNAWHSLSAWLRNIRIGLGLICSKKEYPTMLILEIGADHPNDIRRVARWLRPDIAVITKVSRTPVHVEFFASPEEVFEEKASLAEHVKKGGTVILLADDEKVMSIAERVRAQDPRIITFGTNVSATIRVVRAEAEYDENTSPIGMQFEFVINGENKVFSVPHIIGETYQYPLLAAAAVSAARGVSREKIVSALSSYHAPKGRMHLIPGKNGSVIIDDTYNSSPDAASAALQSLKQLTTSGKKIAALGDMLELGKYSAEEHRRIGKEAASMVSELVTVGQRSRGTAEEAVKNGMKSSVVHAFDTAHEAAEFLDSKIQKGDIVLVKGSQSIRMEYVVKALMAEPGKSSELLVRQESEWLKKK